MAAALPKGVCKYDGYCTRKNPSHFTEFTHPSQYPNGYPLTVVAPKKVPVAALPLPTLVGQQSDGDVPPHTPVNQTPSVQRKLSPPPTPHASRRHTTILEGVSSSCEYTATTSTTCISITAAEASSAGLSDYDKWRTPTLPLATTNPFACFISSPTAVDKGHSFAHHTKASAGVMAGAQKDPQWQHQQRAESFDSNATLLEDEEDNTANLSSSATAANTKRPRAPDVPTHTHTIGQPSVLYKEKGHGIDGAPRSTDKVYVAELTSPSSNANGTSLPSRAPIPLSASARVGGVEAGERNRGNASSAVNSNGNVREDEKKRGTTEVASHSQPPASSANKKLPFLLQDMLDEAPLLSDYLVSAPLLGPNDPIKSLADLYRLALPESEMRAILNLAINSSHPQIHGACRAPTIDRKQHDAILGAFPAVRLVGPFEHLLRIMLQEKAIGGNGSAQNNNLTRADFPSDVALWSDWRFRQDPLEAITFLVPSALYEEHKTTTTTTTVPLPNSSIADQQNNGQVDTCESTTIKAHEGNAIRLVRFGHCCGDDAEQQQQQQQERQKPLQLDMALPPVSPSSGSKSSVERLVSLSFYRDDWFEETIADNPSPPIQGSDRDTKGGNGPSRQLTILRRTIVGPSSGTSKRDTERGNTSLTEVGRRLCSLSLLLSSSAPNAGGANGVLRPRFTPITASVGRAVSHVIELLKEPLMRAIGDGGKEKTFVVDLKQLDVGQKLLTLYAPVTEREVEKEKKRRDKQSFGTTSNQLRVCIPFVKYTEMGYRDPHLELAQLASTIDKLTAFASSGTYAHHPHPSQSHSPATKCKGLSVKEREALDEELRCVDIGNDECDFGYGLEVGQNLLYTGCGGCLCKSCIVEHLKEEEQEAKGRGRGGVDSKHRREVLERAVIGEALWHAVRVLDTAYGLLNRPFGRFALRCYVRLLVLGKGRFELAQAMPK